MMNVKHICQIRLTLETLLLMNWLAMHSHGINRNPITYKEKADLEKSCRKMNLSG